MSNLFFLVSTRSPSFLFFSDLVCTFLFVYLSLSYSLLFSLLLVFWVSFLFSIYHFLFPSLLSLFIKRHGCCVLQRCIDHASPTQKSTLVSEIISNVLQLVQDPFGNYVVSAERKKESLAFVDLFFAFCSFFACLFVCFFI